MSGTPQGGMCVLLRRFGNLVLCDPPADHVLGESLRYWERIDLRGRELNVYLKQQRAEGVRKPKNFRLEQRALYTLCQHEGRVMGIFPAGLLSRAIAALRAAGHSYRIGDDLVARPQLEAPDPRGLDGLTPRGNQLRLLATLLAEEYGCLDLSTGGGKSSYFMAAICRLFPHTRILIMVPQSRGIAIAKTIRAKLMENGVFPGLVMASKCELNERVLIANPHGVLTKLGGLCDQIRIVIADEVYTTAAPTAANALSQIRFARMYGLADGPFTRGDGRNMLIESYFGPVVARSTYQESVKHGMVVPLRVLTFDVHPSAEPAMIPSSTEACKRVCYWRNRIRNQAIAESLEYGAKFLGMPLAECQTLILVECLEHALRLQQMLPNFVIAHAGSVGAARRKALVDQLVPIESDDVTRVSMTEKLNEQLDMSSKRLDKLREDFESGTLKHAIATPIWSAGVDFTCLRMLVRADGRSGEISNIQWTGRSSRLAEGKSFGLVLDYLDKFSDWSAGRAERRLKIYRGRGHEILSSQLRLPLL